MPPRPGGVAMDSYPGPYGQVLTNLFLNAVTHGFGDGRPGAIDIAIRERDAANIEIGGKKVKFEMLPEDDEANPTKATTVAEYTAAANTLFGANTAKFLSLYPAKTDADVQALRLFLARAAVGRPFVAPGGVPADRIVMEAKAINTIENSMPWPRSGALIQLRKKPH